MELYSDTLQEREMLKGNEMKMFFCGKDMAFTVEMVGYKHHTVEDEKPETDQRAKVVEVVGLGHGQTQPKGQEIDSKEHLG